MDPKTLRLRSLRLAKEAAENSAKKRNADIRRARAEAILDDMAQRARKMTADPVLDRFLGIG